MGSKLGHSHCPFFLYVSSALEEQQCPGQPPPKQQAGRAVGSVLGIGQ